MGTVRIAVVVTMVSDRRTFAVPSMKAGDKADKYILGGR